MVYLENEAPQAFPSQEQGKSLTPRLRQILAYFSGSLPTTPARPPSISETLPCPWGSHTDWPMASKPRWFWVTSVTLTKTKEQENGTAWQSRILLSCVPMNINTEQKEWQTLSDKWAGILILLLGVCCCVVCLFNKDFWSSKPSKYCK